jgi:hypothetical protein
MGDRLSDYLDDFEHCLDVDSEVRASVSRELRAHLEDRGQELKESGLSEEEAFRVATDSFGSFQSVAREMYELYSQGSWQEAFFAALPHLLVASLLASYYWQSIPFVLLILIATACVVIYGWCHEKPVWFFPWLGYYLLPVIIGGILLVYLLQGWTWLAAMVYIPLAAFILTHIVKQTASRDWLYVSLTFAPVPVVLSWLLSLGVGGEFFSNGIRLGQLQEDLPWVASSFLALAVATLSCVRLRRRWFKTAVLLTPPVVILASVTFAAGGEISLYGWLILILSLCAVLGPGWLQYKLQ